MVAGCISSDFTSEYGARATSKNAGTNNAKVTKIANYRNLKKWKIEGFCILTFIYLPKGDYMNTVHVID